MSRPTSITRLFMVVVSAAVVGGIALARPESTAAGTLPQFLTFRPPVAVPIGSSITLHATSSAGLHVSFSTTTPTVCSITEATAQFTAAGTCVVKATQPGNATYAAVSTTKEIVVAAHAYDAVAVASLGGVERTDGTVRVGDDLVIRLGASDTDVTWCHLDISVNGSSMYASGLVEPDGSCVVELVVPEPPSYLGPDGLVTPAAVCIDGFLALFTDGTFSSDPDPANRRVMAMGDRSSSAAAKCGSRNTEQAPEILDLGFVAGGSPRPFASTPKLLSWNPLDWDPSFQPLRFHIDWQVDFPAWVTGCNAPFVQGSWAGVVIGQDIEPGSCQPWGLHLPGILPATIPDNEPLTNWTSSLVFRYLDDRGELGVTQVHQDVPFDASDGKFSASKPAIFPVDVAASRFVDAGMLWTPSFRVSGSTPATCTLTLMLLGQDPDHEDHVASVSPDGVCAFSLGPFELYSDHQYWVAFDDGTNKGQFGSFIESITPATAPTIPDPTLGTSGTSVSAIPGAGQGLSLEVSVAPQGSGAVTNSATITGAGPIATSVCSATAWSPTLATGGELATAIARCGYVPGTYVVTARMVDAAGVVRMRTRTITLLADAKRPTTSAPKTRLRSGISLSGSSLPIRVSWSGADTGGAGIARYQLSHSTDGGTTWSMVNASLTGTSFDTIVPSAGTVRYRVRALDRAGNAGSWATGPTLSPRLKQETSKRIAYSRAWHVGSNPSYSGGGVRYASRASASATYRFTGRAIAFVTTKSPARGKVKIYVDGRYAATVDTYDASTTYRCVVWQRSWASSGAHTVQFVVFGTGGRPRVDVDALARF